MRSYLPDSHPDKAREIGSEGTPAAFIDVLLAWTAAVGRVLAPHGSLVVELGDTYAGSGGAGGDYGDQSTRAGQPKFVGSGRRNRPADVAAGILAPTRRPGPDGRDRIPGWPLAKSLAGIPQAYQLSLTYGRNVLTGAESPAGMWRVRNVKPWIRSNPPVGALGDKERPATSYVIVATRATDRYFDLDSARTGTPAARPARRAVPSVPDTHVVPTTLHARRTSTPRGWCDPGQSKVTIGPAVTWQTQRLEVVEPVGFLVGVEQVEGPQVMDLEAAGSPAVLASVVVTVECLLAGAVPVPSPVAGSASVPTGVVLASEVDAPPLSGALEAAEVVSQDLALVAGEWLAARITLDLDGARRTAFAIAPVTSPGHSGESRSKYPTSVNGAPPRDWWHHVDAILDAELDHRAGRPNANARTAQGVDRRANSGKAADARRGGQWSTLDTVGPGHDGGTTGARGVHLRRALERAGILQTLDALDVSPKGYSGSHYAVWPPDLVRLLLAEMAPRRVCTTCGHPSRRLVETVRRQPRDDSQRRKHANGERPAAGRQDRAPEVGWEIDRATVGWSDCGHGTWRRGLVLDPFAGSGTTGAVATGMGLDCLLIDIDERNADLARDRIGMFLEVDDRPEPATQETPT